MSNYNKFKDSAPEDTIRSIREILDRAGLETNIVWTEHKYRGAKSNRVSITPSTLGTNGKGTDELYASASGYAELMERIENNMLVLRMLRPRVAEHGDFVRFPDERKMEIRGILDQKDSFLTTFFRETGLLSGMSQYLFLRKFAEKYDGLSDGTMVTVPYADPFRGEIVWLPDFLVQNVHGSNGMAAGNTIEEAIVQGMCEIFERHVNVLMIKGEAVPPEIPREELEGFSFWSLVEQLEEGGRYHVSIRDCSLGKGLPVAASVITNRLTGGFVIKLGSHPSMAVAVERTLTEAFQGHSDPEMFTRLSSIGTREMTDSFINIPNVMKVGSGYYPARMFSGKPDWEYKPWTEWQGLDNAGFLRKMLDMLRAEGRDVYIRDNSHLGFPAVQIVVPGYSNMYELGPTLIRSVNTITSCADSFSRFPDITEEEEERILRLILFKRGSVLENQINMLSLRPVAEGQMSINRIGAFIALKHENYAAAIEFLSVLLQTETDENEKAFYSALVRYCVSRITGLDNDEAVHLVSELHGEEAAAKTGELLSDRENILKKNFPRLRCWDCSNCGLNGNGCTNLIEESILIRIKDAMKDSRVSQQELLERLMQSVSK